MPRAVSSLPTSLWVRSLLVVFQLLLILPVVSGGNAGDRGANLALWRCLQLHEQVWCANDFECRASRMRARGVVTGKSGARVRLLRSTCPRMAANQGTISSFWGSRSQPSTSTGAESLSQSESVGIVGTETSIHAQLSGQSGRFDSSDTESDDTHALGKTARLYARKESRAS